MGVGVFRTKHFLLVLVMDDNISALVGGWKDNSQRAKRVWDLGGAAHHVSMYSFIQFYMNREFDGELT